MSPQYNITKDDLSSFAGKGSAFVTFGETMIGILLLIFSAWR